MSRLRLSDQLRSLQQKQQCLLSQISGLARAKRALLLRHAMLSCWCDALSLVQLNVATMQLGAASVEHEASKFESLLQGEVQLLQKLTSAQEELGSYQPTLEELLQPDDTVIAPWQDPMQYLCQFLQRPPMEEAATMSGQDVAKILQSTVQKVSIQLHQLTGLPPWDKPNMINNIKERWDRYMHCMVSLVLVGRQDIVEQAHCINLETFEFEPQQAAEVQATQAVLIVPLLQLSEQQQEVISVGMHLHYDMLAAVHQERQDVNSQMAVLQAERSSGNSKRASSSSSSSRKVQPPRDGGSPNSGSSDQLESLPDRQELLEKQQELTSRLHLLLHKEYKLRMTAMGWFIGCLTFEQLSQIAILSWPYAPRCLFVATEVMQHREKLIEQRAQMGA